MYTNSRENRSPFAETVMEPELPTICPKCHQAELEHLHKKAKKSNLDWKCPACGEIYRTINMLSELPDS